MIALDLYCGAGMAADGYYAAGFTEIVGVDLYPQPHYPYEFVQGDAIEYLLDVIEDGNPRGFAMIHASPPCQAHTRAQHLRDAQGSQARFEDLLTPTLKLLRGTDIPWVVENVPGAPGMGNAATLCGSSFGLGVRRHRLFESNVWFARTECRHEQQGRPWGVYHRMKDEVPDGGRTVTSIEQAWEVMGVDREIPWASLKEGFPPAYTRFVGEQVIEWLEIAS